MSYKLWVNYITYEYFVCTTQPNALKGYDAPRFVRTAQHIQDIYLIRRFVV